MLSAVKDTFSRLIYSSSHETGGRKRTLEGSVEEEEIQGDGAGEPARKRYRTLTDSDDDDQNVIIKRQGSVGLKRFFGGNTGGNLFQKMSSWMSSFSSSGDLSHQNGNENYGAYGNKAGQDTRISTERKAPDELDNSSSLLNMHVKKKESMFTFSQMPPISRNNSSAAPIGGPISHLLDFPIRPRPELHPPSSVNHINQNAQQSTSTPKMGGLHNGAGGQEAMSPISPVISPEFRFSPSVTTASLEGRRKHPLIHGKESKFSKPMKNSPSRKIPLFGKLSGSIHKSSLFNRPGVHSNSKSRFGSLFSRRSSAVQESFRMEDKMRYKEMIQQFNPSQSPSLHAPSFTSAESITTTPSQSRSVSPLLAAIQKDVYSESWTIQKRRTLEEAIKGKQSYLSPHPRLSSTQIASSTPQSLSASASLPLGASASVLAKSKTKPTTNRFLRDLSSHKLDPDDSNLREEKELAKDSDSESIIVTGEVKKPRSHLNSLEQKLKQSPYYDMNWLKSLNEKHDSFIATNETSASREKNFKKEISTRREKMVRSKEKEMVRRMSFLDIAYPSKVLELGPEEEELAELTPQMEDMIDVWMRGPPGQQLTEKFNIQITRRDVQTLAGLNWLNDEVINFYMNLLVERGQNNGDVLNVHAFNTFFYPKLMKQGYATIKRWTKKVDVFGQDLLLVPVHLGMHWCLATVDFRDKCVRYYDSMLGDNDRCLQALLEYLHQEHQDKKKSPYNTDDWSLENVKNIPQQMNGSDCGMFSCKFAEYLARDAHITFNQEHMPYFRRRMVYEIVTNGLLSP